MPNNDLKRKKFISYAKDISSKYFWKRLFEETDKRDFVKAQFIVENFGIYIHSRKHFRSSKGKYSLMFTRPGVFLMNNVPGNELSWNDALERLKHYCITPGLPEKFYSELRERKLLIGVESIEIESIVKGKNYEEIEDILKDYFYCIDLFM